MVPGASSNLVTLRELLLNRGRPDGVFDDDDDDDADAEGGGLH
jgi:hypothetical protein